MAVVVVVMASAASMLVSSAAADPLTREWSFSMSVVRTSKTERPNGDGTKYSLVTRAEGRYSSGGGSTVDPGRMTWSAGYSLTEKAPMPNCGGKGQSGTGKGDGKGSFDETSGGFSAEVFGLRSASVVAFVPSSPDTYDVKTKIFGCNGAVETTADGHFPPPIGPLFLPGTRAQLDAMPIGKHLRGGYSAVIGGDTVSVKFKATKTGRPKGGDLDRDGVDLFEDNCTLVKNPDQANFDGDDLGDACDHDDDGDGVEDGYDTCPRTILIIRAETTKQWIMTQSAEGKRCKQKPVKDYVDVQPPDQIAGSKG